MVMVTNRVDYLSCFRIFSCPHNTEKMDLLKNQINSQSVYFRGIKQNALRQVEWLYKFTDSISVPQLVAHLASHGNFNNAKS